MDQRKRARFRKVVFLALGLGVAGCALMQVGAALSKTAAGMYYGGGILFGTMGVLACGGALILFIVAVAIAATMQR